MKVVVLGAGIGGKVVAAGIKNKFPDHDVTLIGPESPEPEGLFYFNKKIPRIAEKPIRVEYECFGDYENSESFKNYQFKSRGSYNPNLKISSFSKIGTYEKGYLLNNNFSLEKVNWVKSFCSYINPINKEVFVENEWYEYDKLISTIPINVFVRMAFGVDISSCMNYKPVYVVDFSDEKFNINEVDKVVVHYDVNDNMYYRHSTYYLGDKVLKVSSESINPSVKDLSATSTVTIKTLPYGKIIPSDLSYVTANHHKFIFTPEFIETSLKDVKLVGRYARWDYHYTIDQSYYDAIKFIKS